MKIQNFIKDLHYRFKAVDAHYQSCFIKHYSDFPCMEVCIFYTLTKSIERDGKIIPPGEVWNIHIDIPSTVKADQIINYVIEKYFIELQLTKTDNEILEL